MKILSPCIFMIFICFTSTGFSLDHSLKLNSDFSNQDNNSVFYEKGDIYQYFLTLETQGDYILSDNLFLNFRDEISLDLETGEGELFLYSINMEYFLQPELALNIGKNSLNYSNSNNWTFLDIYEKRLSRNETIGVWMGSIFYFPLGVSLFYIPEIDSIHHSIANQDNEVAGVSFSKTTDHLNLYFVPSYNFTDSLQSYRLSANYNNEFMKNFILQIDTQFYQKDSVCFIRQSPYYAWLATKKDKQFFNQTVIGVKTLFPYDFSITTEFYYNQAGYDKNEYSEFKSRLQANINNFRQIARDYLALLYDSQTDLCKYYLGFLVNKDNFIEDLSITLGAKFNLYDFSYILFNEYEYSITENLSITSTIAWQNGEDYSEFEQRFYKFSMETTVVWNF